MSDSLIGAHGFKELRASGFLWRHPVTGAVIAGDDLPLFRTDLPEQADVMPGDPPEVFVISAALGTTTTIRVSPTRMHRKCRISWTNNGANAAAKLNIAANCANDVEGLLNSQSPLMRDEQIGMGELVLLISPVPMLSLNLSADMTVGNNTHRLVLAFGE